MGSFRRWLASWWILHGPLPSKTNACWTDVCAGDFPAGGKRAWRIRSARADVFRVQQAGRSANWPCYNETCTFGLLELISKRSPPVCGTGRAGCSGASQTAQYGDAPGYFTYMVIRQACSRPDKYGLSFLSAFSAFRSAKSIFPYRRTHTMRAIIPTTPSV